MSVFLAGLIAPDVLQNAEFIDSARKCSVLEIRYDLFSPKDWGLLAKKIASIHPSAIRLGTIRLNRDGGAWPDKHADGRIDLFESLIPDLHWIDIERGTELPLFEGIKILRSWHLFDRIPSEKELEGFANECLNERCNGCKVAAMSKISGDYEPLYNFAGEYGKKFEWLSAFAMGETGKESRMRSLEKGANLTYGSISQTLAPGQMNVREMLV